MGLCQNKDPLISIYLSLNKGVHDAGSLVEGGVHIICKFHRPYKELFVQINGKEKVSWTEQEARQSVNYYAESRKTYISEFVLARFNNCIEEGQYTFPFSFFLPQNMPASFSCLDQNFIKYSISASLRPQNGKGCDQTFQMPLHVRQPCRLVENAPANRLLFRLGNQCCCFFQNLGSVEIIFQTDTVNLFQGKKFIVRGLLNNKYGKVNIKGVKFILSQTMSKYTSNNYQKFSTETVLGQYNKCVFSGGSINFTAQIAVPFSFLGYTAIGNIISRSYFLKVVPKDAAFIQNVGIQRHMILNNNIQPQMLKLLNNQVPLGWNPQVQGVTSFLNLKPYYYNPHPAIKMINQIGPSNRVRWEQMKQKQSIRENLLMNNLTNGHL